MKVLIACEESQAVTIAMRKLGIEAYSCDIIECSGGHPKWHIQGDVLKILDKKWDMIIAFPPCTFLSAAGARWLFPKGILNKERYKKGLKAKEFFMKILNADCEKVVVENPTPLTIYELPYRSQVIQPFFFGDPYKKRTCLWIKGVDPLKHYREDDPIGNKKTHVEPTQLWVNTRKNSKLKGINRSAKSRSKTFPGIANAFALQWGVQ